MSLAIKTNKHYIVEFHAVNMPAQFLRFFFLTFCFSEWPGLEGILT